MGASENRLRAHMPPKFEGALCSFELPCTRPSDNKMVMLMLLDKALNPLSFRGS